MDVVSLTNKVLSGQAGDSEKEELAEWIAKSDENRREFEDIKLLWENSTFSGNAVQHDDSGFEKIRLRFRKQLRKQRRIRTVFWSLVLILVVLVLVLILRHTWLAI